MRAAIEDAELDVKDIDAIYASANGSPKADALERRAIEKLFGNVSVVATKGIFGEYAAGGALQIAAALVALDEGKARHVLVNSLSAGGGIVCAVLSA